MAPEIKDSRSELSKAMRFPLAAVDIIRNRRALKKELLKQPNLVPTRIAILGGSTTV